MIGINTWPSWADAYEVGLGALQWAPRALWSMIAYGETLEVYRVSLTMDPTDVLTIPAAVFPVWIHMRSYH